MSFVSLLLCLKGLGFEAFRMEGRIMAIITHPTRIFDLHCDTLDRLALHNAIPEAGFMAEDSLVPAHRMSSLADNAAHIDLTRMARAQYAWCQCFAAFIPDGLGEQGSLHVFNTVHSYFKEQLAQHAGLIEQVMDARDIRRIVDEGRCAAMFTVEGGSFLGEELDRVYEAADLGVKMITLTWNDKNAIASGNKTTDGLSFFGRDVVRTMEKRRVVVDVSHLNDRSFWEVLEVAERPLVASHSNSRKICAHPRNLTDDQFRAIVERGGLVGLNYCKRFLSEAGYVTHDDVLRHVDHLLELGGEHVLALGSDYDGCDVPEWLCPAEKVGNLYDLLSREFGQDIADAICFENACAFFERNEQR